MQLPQVSDPTILDIRLPSTLQHYEISARCLDRSIEQLDMLFEARDTRLSRPVFIRQLRVADQQSDDLLRRARSIASLKHPCFVKIHAIEFDLEYIWIVTEKLDAVPLRLRISDHHGDEKTILRYLLQLAKALSEAHALGIAHGQLSAAHLLIDQTNHIRLDYFRFDLSALAKSNDVIDRFDKLADIAYLAPENFRNNQMTASADMYALGVIFYEMLIGHLPFAQLQGLSLVAAQLQTTSDHWTWSPALSSGAHTLMLKLTSNDSGTRMTAEQVAGFARETWNLDLISGSLDSLSVRFLQQQIQQKEAQASYKRSRIIWASIVIFALCTVLLTQFEFSFWRQLISVVQPYSERQDLEQGVQALAFFYRTEKLEQAEHHFNQVLIHRPRQAEAIAGLSIVYNFRYGDESRDEVWREKAKAAAQQAMTIDADSALVQVANALVLGRFQSQSDRANTAIQTAILSAPKNQAVHQLAHRMRVRILVWNRQYDAGLEKIRLSLEEYPDDWFMYQMQGLIELNRARFDESAISLRNSLQLNPDVPSTYAFLSQALDSQEKSQDAMQVLQQGLQIRPSASLYGMLGHLSMSSRDYVAAAAAFRKATSPESGNPRSYENWLELGEALLHLEGMQKESRESFEKALELITIRSNMMPNDGWSMAIKARIHARLGDLERAQELAKKSVTLAPKNPAVHACAAVVFVLSGKPNEASKEIELVRQLGFPEKYLKSESVFDSLLSKKK